MPESLQTVHAPLLPQWNRESVAKSVQQSLTTVSECPLRLKEGFTESFRAIQTVFDFWSARDV